MGPNPLPALEIPTIPSLFVEQMLAAAGSTLLTDHPVARRARAGRKLSVAEYVALVSALNEHCDDEMIGMLDRAVPLGSFAVLCNMLAHSPTVEAALESYNRFYSLFIADHQPLLLIDSAADRLLLTVNPALPASHAPYFAYSTLLGVVKLLGWLCGQRLAPYKITLGFEPFGVDSEFAYLFGTEPEYGNLTRAEYSLEVCRYAVAPVIDASEFSRQRTSYLLLWGMDERFERQVYALVADRLERGRVSSEVIAEQLHMARQTLARRLQEAGTSYSAVLERVRKDKAIAMLRTTTMPLLSVADSLGYSDTRSFSRAFKRWTGKAPGAYRRE